MSEISDLFKSFENLQSEIQAFLDRQNADQNASEEMCLRRQDIQMVSLYRRIGKLEGMMHMVSELGPDAYEEGLQVMQNYLEQEF